MKILVLSDSHGNVDNMIRAVERESPRAIFHLGDCWRDGQRLHDRFPEIPFEQVPGNCDFRSQEAAERLTAFHPLLVDAVPLTLEEIFIYELGGADYAVKDIVL